MPLNLVDPASGIDYFTAATALITQLEANGLRRRRAVSPIPYWENLFPDAAGRVSRSATRHRSAAAYATTVPTRSRRCSTST